ncbi:ATP-binding protein [Pedobacter sp. PWIIR3]
MRQNNLFGIFQECSNNIIQHAHASQIVVTLKSDGNSFSLSIADNGVGFILNNLMFDQKGVGHKYL